MASDHAEMIVTRIPCNRLYGGIEYAEISIVLTIARTISYRHLSIAISSL